MAFPPALETLGRYCMKEKLIKVAIRGKARGFKLHVTLLQFVAFSILLRTRTVHSEVSVIIYSALIFIYATLFLAVRFVVTFESLAKTLQFLKMICGDYSRSYFNLFLIYTVAHNTQTFTNIKAVLIVQKVDLIQQYCVILTYSFHRNCSCLGS